jgi:hypothetical protein
MNQPGDEFEDRYQRLQQSLPDPFSRFLGWAKRPSSRWMRIPLGIVLIIGGLLSFLPILGIWMLPLGVLLLALELPFLRRPLVRALDAIGRRWRRRRSKRRDDGS